MFLICGEREDCFQQGQALCACVLFTASGKYEGVLRVYNDFVGGNSFLGVQIEISIP